MKAEAKRRSSKFRLGQIHGKPVSEKADSYAKIYFNHRAVLVRSAKDKVAVRLFGVDGSVKDYSRKKAKQEVVTHFMGYDKDHNLYLIKLKRQDSAESVDEAVEQLGRYAKVVREILPDLEKEFKAEFFLDIRFNAVKSILLAEREFFSDKRLAGILPLQ